MAMRTQWTHIFFTAIPNDINPDSVTAFLHNHNAMINLSPLVTSHEHIPCEDTQSKVYDIRKRINVLPLGLWNQEIKLTAVFENAENGMWTKLNAPMGLESEATYTILKTGDEVTGCVDAQGNDIETEWVLKETIVSSCNLFLKNFVDASMVPARRETSQKLMDAVRTQDT